MAWIESHQSLLNHPKTIQAADILRCDRVKLIGHLHCLWWWALDVVDFDGNFPPRCTNPVIAQGAQWKGKAEGFVTALVDAGFIDITPDGDLQLHDWYEYAGKYNARKDGNKQRMRDARAAHMRIHPENRAELPTSTTNQPTNQPNQPDLPTHQTDPVMDAAAIAFGRFGKVTSGTAPAIEEAFAEYGPEWVPKAIREAATGNFDDKPHWGYVEAILERWKRQGGPDDKHAQTQRNGLRSSTIGPTGESVGAKANRLEAERLAGGRT